MGDLTDLTKDHLKDLQPAEIAAWYLRLAALIEKKNNKVKNALAPAFLRHYIQGRGKELKFPPPDHLKSSKYVVDVLKDHRAWYLTEKPFKGKWVGIIPRLQGKHPAAKWDAKGLSDTKMPLTLALNSLVEIEVKWFSSHTPGDTDLMTSLRGFQLHTFCAFSLSAIPGKSDLRVNFLSWSAYAADRYDFDADEHFTVPNPDYNNPSKVARPVAPRSEMVTVYHRNAIRMEKAGHAKPYDLHSEPWIIIDPAIAGPAQISPTKKLGPVLPWQ